MADPFARFPRGRFIWHELVTADPDAALDFYARVIGWKAQPWKHDASYRLLMMGRVPMAGLMAGTPPHWMPYVAVPDVDATVREARALGARALVEPQDVVVGRFATLADPQGAAFSVYQPAPDQPLGTDDTTAGDFSWHELGVADWKQAWEFYSTLFGWEPESSVEVGPCDTYWMFKRAGGTRPLGGLYGRPAGAAGPPHWMCYARVTSADLAAETAALCGAKILQGPMEVPGGDRIATFVDPQGARLAVHARAARISRGVGSTLNGASLPR